MDTKNCTKCFENMELEKFQKDHRYSDGYSSWCKSCKNELSARYQKQWAANNREAAKSIQLKTRYGIDLKRYNEILEIQNFSCAICKKHESEFGRKLSVDHCHDTGVIRGLLCGNCNTAIGKLKDNKQLLNNAIDYLLIKF